VRIDTGKRVRIQVNLAIAGGETIEKSVVEYIHGDGKMLPGLETALTGLNKGASKKGTLRAKDAFGNLALSPKKAMKRHEFPREAQLRAGERFTAKGINGADVVLSIDKIQGEDIEVRLLHPLADKDISYEVEVLSVTDPLPPPVPGEALELQEE
jgi:FKBP-type peptidyl-prolyl cis-trans isomerase SlyD